MGQQLRAELVLGVVAAGWGLSFVVMKGVLPLVPAHGLIAGRFLLATAVLLLVARSTLPHIRPRAVLAGLLAGLVLWGGFSFQTLGLLHTEPARSAFLTALYVPLTPLLARLLLRVPLERSEVAAALLAFVGLGLLAGPRQLEAPNAGDLLTIAGAVCFALHILVLDRVSGLVGVRLLGVLQVGACGALSLPFAAAAGAPVWLLDPPVVAAIVYLGLVCTAFAYVAQPWAQRFTTPSRTAVILSLEAVFAAFASMLWTAERLDPLEWLGAGLVLGAALLGQGVGFPRGFWRN